MGFIQEFKEFAIKGNVVDLAVAVVIGAAFGKIVSSFVADIIMPIVGYFVGGVDFTDLSYVLQAAEGDVAEVALAYGAFIQTLFDFLIVAFAIFMAVKGINNMKKEEPEPEPAGPSVEEGLLTEIRDLLAKK